MCITSVIFACLLNWVFENFQLLDAVSRMASLGFEKSYRETIVLMTRSYMEKIKNVNSGDGQTVPPEAITERVEVCSVFLFELRSTTC